MVLGRLFFAVLYAWIVSCTFLILSLVPVLFVLKIELVMLYFLNSANTPQKQRTLWSSKGLYWLRIVDLSQLMHSIPPRTG